MLTVGSVDFLTLRACMSTEGILIPRLKDQNRIRQHLLPTGSSQLTALPLPRWHFQCSHNLSTTEPWRNSIESSNHNAHLACVGS